MKAPSGPVARAAAVVAAAALAVVLAAVLAAQPEEPRGRVLATRAAMTAGAAVTAGALWRRRDVVAARVRTFLGAPRDPLDLAVLRVVVAWQIAASISPGLVRTWAAVPRELQVPPATGIPPLGTLAPLAVWPTLPLASLPIDALLAALPVACLAAAVGLCSRLATAAAGVLFFVLFGILAWHRQVGHAHHLLWLAALLAVARSGDALSVDALVRRLRRRPGPAPSAVYGTPLAFAMLLVALVYLFPGLAKLWTSGVDWFLGDNLRYTMYREWWVRGGWTSPIPLDAHPLLYRSAGAATVLFEVGFAFAVFHPRLRLAWAATGVLFHVISSLTMGIIFTPLLACYVAFVEWGRLLRRRPPEDRPPGRAVVAIGTCLVAGALGAGAARAVDGWPFAAYPLFNGIQGPTHPRLAIELVAADGVRRVEAHDYRTRFGYRWHQTLGRIVAEPEPARARRLAVFWDAFTRDVPELRDVREVRFLQVVEWIAPERTHDPPASTTVLYTWTPAGASP